MIWIKHVFKEAGLMTWFLKLQELYLYHWCWFLPETMTVCNMQVSLDCFDIACLLLNQLFVCVLSLRYDDGSSE